MTILVDFQLKSLINGGRLKVFPLMDGAIQPNSIDVRLHNQFAQYNQEYRCVELDPYSKNSTLVGLKRVSTDRILLEKGAFLLAETMESVALPDDICAQIEGKSSLARLGLTVHQTGGWIDCGFEGTITLELVNENPRPIILTAGMPIAQLVFHKTAPAEIPYNMKKNAKYKGQKGPTESRYHENEPQTANQVDSQCSKC